MSPPSRLAFFAIACAWACDSTRARTEFEPCEAPHCQLDSAGLDAAPDAGPDVPGDRISDSAPAQDAAADGPEPDARPDAAPALDADEPDAAPDDATTGPADATAADGADAASDAEWIPDIDAATDVPCVAGREVCNGVDDDCDDVVDEGQSGAACYGGPEGTAGVGACRQGIVACQDGESLCDGERAPEPERCDGFDDDCDGVVDEGVDCVCEDGAERECYSGPLETLDVGSCRAGRQVCRGGAWGDCEGERLPFERGCDNRDRDCDGFDQTVTDEPCVLGVGACVHAGRIVCMAGGQRCFPLVSEPAPRDEVCNGVDDDCDGRIDEDFGELGQRCQIQIGACFATGVNVCGAGGAGYLCDAAPPVPTPEVCNGRDEDCDGQVDEGPLLDPVCPPLDPEQPECGRMGRACVDAAPVGECQAQAAIVEELCNGADDDCDGLVDEFPRLINTPCRAGRGACVREGLWACREGGPVCDVAPGAPGVEVCNNLDDDCDGAIDEDVAPDEACVVDAAFGCPRMGATTCVAGVVLCRPPPEAAPDEVCDGEDNDCDLRVDEGFGVGVACVARFDQCEVPGILVCDGDGRRRCSAPGFAPSPEVCDGADNDCDGTIDEFIPAPCELAGCGPGLTRCVGGELLCDASDDDILDACDGEDNDCDGVVDEDGCAEGRCVDAVCVCHENRLDIDAEPGCEGGLGAVGPPLDLLGDAIAVDVTPDGPVVGLLDDQGTFRVLAPDGSMEVIDGVELGEPVLTHFWSADGLARVLTVRTVQGRQLRSFRWVVGAGGPAVEVDLPGEDQYSPVAAAPTEGGGLVLAYVAYGPDPEHMHWGRRLYVVRFAPGGDIATNAELADEGQETKWDIDVGPAAVGDLEPGVATLVVPSLEERAHRRSFDFGSLDEAGQFQIRSTIDRHVVGFGRLTLARNPRGSPLLAIPFESPPASHVVTRDRGGELIITPLEPAGHIELLPTGDGYLALASGRFWHLPTPCRLYALDLEGRRLAGRLFEEGACHLVVAASSPSGSVLAVLHERRLRVWFDFLPNPP